MLYSKRWLAHGKSEQEMGLINLEPGYGERDSKAT
jgi:hypothetical protein